MEADIFRIRVLKRGGEKVFNERTGNNRSCVGSGINPKLCAGEKFLYRHGPQSPGIVAKWEQQKEQDYV